ncbi:MAG TPA: DsbA family protein [Chloroflexota bacterium]|nr:DsbA family protein [Chloroflexota bacterium]
MESTPTIHMWHDYVCPFCNVEATRIRRIKDEDNLRLDVRFHPWPLEAADGAQPRAEDEDKWVALLRPLEPEAFADWDPASGYWPASSRLLFAAYEAALVQDAAAAERFDLLVRQAIFQHPEPIDSVEPLSALAGNVGLDVTLFRAMLEDGTAASRARTAETEGKLLGIRGIPTLDLPNGSKVISPGMKIHRSVEGTTIRDDIDVLRALLRNVAGVEPAGIG